MKKMIGLTLTMVFILATFAGGVVSGAEAAEMPAAKKEPGCPLPVGKAVMEYVTKNNPYKKWNLWPEKGEMYSGRHPHGAYLTTYLSPLAFYALEDKAGTIPDTAFIVKENYDAEKNLAATTVMYKIEGYNPAAGDWFWLKFLPDGTIEAEGKVAGCISCHTSAKDNDWLLTGPIK